MRCPFAIWRGTIPNETPGGMESPVVGVVFHIMGASYDAADNWFHNPSAQASAHFGIKQDGTLVQWVDTADRAWHAAAANRHWIGVETEGSGGALSEAGCQTFARLYRWLHDTHGVPFAITDDPTNGHGFGWHGMGGSAWGGHDYCPGPERRAQRSHILQLAQGTAPEPTPTPKEDDPVLNIIVIEPGKKVALGFSPCQNNGVGIGREWGSLSVDNYSATEWTEVRVMIHKAGGDPVKGWRPIGGANDKGAVPVFSGRSFAWQYEKNDDCVSIENHGTHAISYTHEAARA